MKCQNINQSFNLDKSVKVYFNLHKLCLSILAYSLDKKGYRLWAHLEEGDVLYLKEISYNVYQGGRERVLKTKQKNVHAFVRGTLTEDLNMNKVDGRVHYNPYKGDSFTLNGKHVFESNYARLNYNFVEAIGLK